MVARQVNFIKSTEHIIIFFSEVKNGGRYIMMQRSSSITGPYLERKTIKSCTA